MSKIAGFTLTKSSQVPQPPPWLPNFPHVTALTHECNGWKILLWGRGDLSQFINGDTIIVGYSGVDLATLATHPLQNRGLVVTLGEKAAVRNDTLGMMQVFYAASGDTVCVSTCEETVIQALGSVTLDPGRLISYLILQSTVATLTLWGEVNKLYANSVLTVDKRGSFRQALQEPLQFQPIGGDHIAAMAGVLRETVERYTDPLDDVWLMLSHGHDSRLILVNMNRPQRIHALTFPLSHPAERAYDVVIARESARLCGVADHAILDLEQDQLKNYTRPSIEFYGTPLGAVQVYLYATCEGIGHANPDWPVVTGMNGDESAGVALNRSRGKLAKESDPADRFVSGCYSWVKAWLPHEMDAVLSFDWRKAVEPVRDVWARAWNSTEGDDLTRHAHLIHTRNRGNQYITYAWQSLDLYGGFVGPIYNDRHYVEFMLSLPHEVLSQGAFTYAVAKKSNVNESRTGQVSLFQRYFPEHYPVAGLSHDKYDWTNRLDVNALRKAGSEALWPLTPDGRIHDFFKSEALADLYRRAANGDMRSYYLLNSVQPLAWAVGKGYVK